MKIRIGQFGYLAIIAGLTVALVGREIYWRSELAMCRSERDRAWRQFHEGLKHSESIRDKGQKSP